MTKKEIQEQIKELQDKLNILSSELEKCENEAVLSIRKPKENELYYFLGFDGKYNYWRNNINRKDIDIINSGNYWFTEEEVKFENEREKYTRLYRKYVKEHNTKFDGNNRYYAYWNEVTEKIVIDCDTGIICAFQIYGSSEEVISNAIKFIGEDNFKKYILQVKE